MSNADDTTIKVRSFSDKGERIVPQNNLTEEQNNALELVKRTAQLEEEKKKSLEHLKTIAQLRENLKLEQAKADEMARKIAVLEAKAIEAASLAAKAKECARLEARVCELTEALGKVSAIAAAAKA